MALFKNSVKVMEVLPVDLVLEEDQSNGAEVTPNGSDAGNGLSPPKSKQLMKELMEICENYCFTKSGDGVVESLRLYLKYGTEFGSVSS